MHYPQEPPPELCNKLEELGYKRSKTFDNSQKFIWTTETHFYSTNNDMLGCSYGENVLPYGIYCGENEQLFLALAALREGSNKFQWFCDDNGLWEMGKSNLPSRYMQMNGHKATPAELIEHFNNQ